MAAQVREPPVILVDDSSAAVTFEGEKCLIMCFTAPVFAF
jgi:hypothetical protein